MEIKGKTDYILGIFDGQNMVGDNQQIYPIPANYASKSKLSEGDKLKLLINGDGQFIYKQVYHQEVIRKKGIVEWVLSECYAIADGKKYRILLSSARYFKLRDGDEVVLLFPKDREVTWAAVENVIRFLKDDEYEKELEI